MPTPRAGEVTNSRQSNVREPGRGEGITDRGRVVAGADERVGVGGAGLDERLDRVAETVGQAEVRGHERMAPIDRRRDQDPAGPEPAPQVREGRRRIGEVLEREARQDEIERAIGKSAGIGAQVDDRELVEMGQGSARLVDVGANQAGDPRPEGAEGGDTAATGVECGDGSRRALSRRP